MGKRVYSSGVMRSDVMEARPPRRGQSPTELRQTVMGPELDDAARAKASANVRRLCPDDAEEMLDALGLLPKAPAKRTARTFDCPTCGAAAGAVCQDSNQSVMKRFHVARNKALTKWLKDNDPVGSSEVTDGR